MTQRCTSKKGGEPKIIYANPRDRYNGWSAMVHPDGNWTVFDEKANVAHRDSSRDQPKGAEDAIRWLRKNGKMT